MDNNTFADIADYDIAKQQLARRRKLAEQLLQTRIEPTATLQGGRALFGAGPGGTISQAIDQFSGRLQQPILDQQERDLTSQEQLAAQQLIARLGKPGIVQQSYDPTTNPGTGPLVNGPVPMTKEEDRQRRFDLYGQGMAIPSLRKTLEAQLGAELKAPLQEDMLETKLAGAQAVADAKNKVMLEGINARIQGAIDLKKTQGAPTIHITNGGGKGGIKAPSGYRYNEDGTALEPIPGGPADKSNAAKPLTAKQLETQRGFMDLESSLANYEQLLDNYDFQGKTAVDPAKRAALEGAYTDVQMKLKTLYDLGAPQAGDLKLLSQSIPNPVDMSGTIKGAAFGSSPFKARLGETRKLLNSSRANFEKQMGKETPEAAKPPAAPVRRKYNATTGEFE